MAFIVVAVFSDVPVWLRLGTLTLGLIGIYAAVEYLLHVREWSRSDAALTIPSLRQPRRSIAVTSTTPLSVVGHFGRTLWVGTPFADDSRRVALNAMVSSADAASWVDPAGTAGTS